jgi:hypothetical protein
MIPTMIRKAGMDRYFIPTAKPDIRPASESHFDESALPFFNQSTTAYRLQNS